MFTSELGEMEILTSGEGVGVALSPMSRLAAGLGSLSLRAEAKKSWGSSSSGGEGEQQAAAASGDDHDVEGEVERQRSDLGSLAFVAGVSRMLAGVMTENLPAGNSDQVSFSYFLINRAVDPRIRKGKFIVNIP